MDSLTGPRALLGESPRFIGPAELAWIDMLAGVVHRADLRTGATVSVAVPVDPPGYVGSLIATDDGLAAVTLTGIARLGHEGRNPEDVVAIVDGTSARLNDAAVDPWGRVWVGSVAVDEVSGGGRVHVWTPGGSVEMLPERWTLPNGIGWSPDGETVYVADSRTGLVLAAEIDPQNYSVGAFLPLIRVTDGEPDGLAVADDGSIWIAIWDGGRVERWSDDGRLAQTIPVPVSRPTACAFGDGELFVTTAQYGLSQKALDAEPLAGHVLRIPVSARGVELNRVTL